jgi:hypothetical protein
MKSRKTLNLPLPEELESNKRNDLVDHFEKINSTLDSAYKLSRDDISRIGIGTEVGQLFYWDGYKLTPIDISNIYWDAINNRLGISTSSPTSKVEIEETVTVKRLLAGGVKLT